MRGEVVDHLQHRPALVAASRRALGDHVDRRLLAAAGARRAGQVVADFVVCGVGGDRAAADRFGRGVEGVGDDADRLPRPAGAEGAASGGDVQLGHRLAGHRAAFAEPVRGDRARARSFGAVEDRLERRLDRFEAGDFGQRFEVFRGDREGDRLVAGARFEHPGTGRFERFGLPRRPRGEVGFDHQVFPFADQAAGPFDRKVRRFRLRFFATGGDRGRRNRAQFRRERRFRGRGGGGRHPQEGRRAGAESHSRLQGREHQYWVSTARRRPLSPHA